MIILYILSIYYISINARIFNYFVYYITDCTKIKRKVRIKINKCMKFYTKRIIFKLNQELRIISTSIKLNEIPKTIIQPLNQQTSPSPNYSIEAINNRYLTNKFLVTLCPILFP